MRFNPTLSLAMLASATAAQLTTQLFNFTSSINIENSQLRPNGHLLLATFLSDLHFPQAKLVSVKKRSAIQSLRPLSCWANPLVSSIVACPL